MSRILSLSMRPRTLSGLFGQEEMVRSIRAMMAKRQPATFMFAGGSGLGKTTAARIIAVSFNCPHMKLWGDPCEACWAAQKRFSIHEINASDNAGVDDMRQVIDIARQRSLTGAKRVIILDEFHRASSAGQNCLLKPMEEPGGGTIWIVCTTEPNKVLATLRRRCVSFQLSPLGIDKREKFLTKYAAAIQCTRVLDPLFEQIHLARSVVPRCFSWR